jgi:hypothetical protein
MTQKAIGPNFPNELAAQGLLGLPFSWGSDGTITFAASMAPAQITAVQNVYAAHNPATVPLAQQAANALAAGAQVNSTGTPALNGTYALDPQSLANITAISDEIANGKGFPGGGSTYDYPDAAFTFHTFPSTAAFINFAQAIASYVSGWKLYGQGHIQTPPSAPLTIA